MWYVKYDLKLFFIVKYYCAITHKVIIQIFFSIFFVGIYEICERVRDHFLLSMSLCVRDIESEENAF